MGRGVASGARVRQRCMPSVAGGRGTTRESEAVAVRARGGCVLLNGGAALLGALACVFHDMSSMARHLIWRSWFSPERRVCTHQGIEAHNGYAPGAVHCQLCALFAI